MGFPKGELYQGTPEQKRSLERQFCRKAEIMYKFKCPIWNGEVSKQDCPRRHIYLEDPDRAPRVCS